ncbi:hypothetical protein F5Y15DRAFT_398925 [Xylariaceae sp. FL0016]|nr:hypothetical protein F5Y15DRAFT_398925 [Xylariaceae sp. FL0016]
MAFGKWSFRSSRNQSSSASSSKSNTSTTGTTTPIEIESQELAKTSSRLVRTFASGFKSQKQRKPAGPDEYPHLHKPFTRQNLEHQKLFEAFEWNFGRTTSHGGRSSFSGVSPYASRSPSFDYDRTLPPSDNDEIQHPPPET